MKILFLTKYSEKGASSRYRFYNYKKWLEDSGFDVTYKPLFGDTYINYLYSNKKFKKNIVAVFSLLYRFFYLVFSIRSFHHIVIEAEIFPRLPLKFDMFFLKKINSFSLDFDDNIAANYAGTSLENKITSLIKKAQFVTVGNHWYFSEFEGNLIYLPTVIDIHKYPDFRTENNTNKTVVWIGSPSTVKYLKLIEKQLVDLSEKIDFTLKIIGAHVALNPKINIEFVQWDSETENKELAECTVGIMPLEDSYWEKGKCGFKLVQYMASGIPVVATGLPANREIVQHGINGFIAENEGEWINYMFAILSNIDVQQSLGKSARQRIEDHYSYQIWGPKYAAILKNQ